MTEAQRQYFEKKGEYNDIILMTNLTMIYSYLMFLYLEESIEHFGKAYKHSTKHNYNKCIDLLNTISKSNIDCFKTNKLSVGQLVLDVANDIENRLNFEDRSIYILFVINKKMNDNVRRFEPEIVSKYKKEIEYVCKTLVEYCPITLDADKLKIATVVCNQVLSKIGIRKESDGSLTIIYTTPK